MTRQLTALLVTITCALAGALPASPASAVLPAPQSTAATALLTQPVSTHARVKTAAEVDRGDRALIDYWVESVEEKEPRGRIDLIVRRVGGVYRLHLTERYARKRKTFRTPALTGVGDYRVVIKFSAKPGTRFGDSKYFAGFRVS